MASTGNKEKRNKVVRNKSRIRQSGDSTCSTSTSVSQQKMHESTNPVSGDRPFSSVPLLDMLAEVASATLKNDPSLNNNPKEAKRISPQKSVIKVPSRKSYCCEHLSLDQIRVLSDKMLLEMFSELVSDEIRKNYSYQCFLMPEKCEERFSSFGSETRARLQMKAHLLTHIAELLAEANAPGKSHRIKFIAEPLHVRRKRLLEGSSKKKRQLRQSERNLKRKVPVFQKEKEVVQMNETEKNFSLENGKTKLNHAVVSPKRDHCASKWKKRNRKLSEHKESNRLNNVETSSLVNTKNHRLKKADIKSNKSYTKIKRKNCNDKEINNSDKGSSQSSSTSNCSTDCAAAFGSDRCNKREVANRIDSSQHNHIDKYHSNCIQLPRRKYYSSSTRSVTNSLNCSERIESISDDDDDDDITESTQEKPSILKENDTTYQTVDPLDQPQHDHCYTTVLGKKHGFEVSYSEKTSCEKGSIVKNSVVTERNSELSHLTISTPCFPFIFTPLLPNISQILEVSSLNSEENNTKQTRKIGYSQTNTGVNVASSAMTRKTKQTRIRRVNKIIIAEELKSDSEEDSENIPSLASGKVPSISLGSPANINENSDSLTEATRKPGAEGTPEWEKKLALKCIRALRFKKKEERGPLQCKICKDKKFTAQATLMYHYRSHAGIKPFRCGVCGSTFTRQHSLNYHMLIHNNKSRFVCNDCGRNFRHPSHYKEHLRRHTGETPYECSDCTLRFKTRNTFKRHLKTRHGKILTAQGIATLTDEEFYKVRTIPRKRLQKCLPIRKKDQETQWPEVNMLKVDNEYILEETR